MRDVSARVWSSRARAARRGLLLPLRVPRAPSGVRARSTARPQGRRAPLTRHTEGRTLSPHHASASRRAGGFDTRACSHLGFPPDHTAARGGRALLCPHRHTRTVPSALPLTTLPSGSTVRAHTLPVCPCSIAAHVLAPSPSSCGSSRGAPPSSPARRRRPPQLRSPAHPERCQRSAWGQRLAHSPSLRGVVGSLGCARSRLARTAAPATHDASGMPNSRR